MALDRAVQLSREAGASPPTLRLYRWSQPTVTLGRFQKATDVDFSACVNGGVQVVRRFTGGRGVLHDDELTYSVVAALDDGIPQGIAASYRHLCQALVDTYQALGVDAQLTSRDRGEPGASACYLHSTKADLSLDGRKLSGSAQVWSGSTVLQHGSFVNSRNVAREADVFGLDDRQSSDLHAHTGTIEEFVGRRVPDTELISAIRRAFCERFGVELIESGYTPYEAHLVSGLLPYTVVTP